MEENTIVELSNDKKYIIVDNTFEDGNFYYLAMELDNKTEEPTDNALFFKDLGDGNLSTVVDENEIKFLETIFTDNFMKKVSNINEKLGE